MAEHREIERKYESTGEGAFVVEDALRGISAMTTAGEPVVHTLDATYFDTDDLTLLRHRITLRRRTGGADAGWHLKLPTGSDDERREFQRPLGRATRTPPKPLLDEIRAYLRGRPVAPVTTLHTRRTERELRAPSGARALVADDQVRAERTADGSVLEWAELEVELIDGRARDLDRIERALTSAGLRRSVWPSKLARALDDPGASPRRSGKRA